MRVFFDTSVIVAASVADHPHHSRAWPALQRVAIGKDQGFVGAHSIAKIYDALLLACAARSGAERVYTFNLSDLRELASVDMQARIAAP